MKRLERPPGATGGNFSEGYIVESGAGQRAFLKALDFSSALQSPDAARALEAMTAAYNFERDLLNKCRDNRLDRVVVSIDDGSVSIDPSNPAGVVQYLIFELADGDVRSRLELSTALDTAWKLRSLHHVATGLFQLHGQGIAHQDLKPSNILLFRGSISKIADLGRAAYQGHEAPHEDYQVAGDWSYAPPELLYGHLPSDWSARRYGCDAYLLGSMVVFLFTALSMTSLLLGALHPSQHWRVWRGRFPDILPFLREAFGRAVDGFEKSVPEVVRDDLSMMLRQLCDPDPALRGHPLTRARKGNPYSLERYVSRFNLLAGRAEITLRAGRS